MQQKHWSCLFLFGAHHVSITLLLTMHNCQRCSFSSGRLCRLTPTYRHTHTLKDTLTLLLLPEVCQRKVCRGSVKPLIQEDVGLTPCPDPRHLLGNRATELAGSAEQDCAWHSIGDVRALISLGGLADGRLSETFDATLDESRGRQRERRRLRQSRSCAELPARGFYAAPVVLRSEVACTLQHGMDKLRGGGWGVDRVWLASSTDKLTLSFFAILSYSSHTIPDAFSELRLGLRPWALASHLTTAAITRGVSGHPAPTFRRHHAFNGPC